MKVRCLDSNQQFLVDSGAAVSILPKDLNDKVDKQCHLQAANNTAIKTYGVKTIKLKLDNKLSIWHTFIKAEVDQPILGADFLANNGFTLNMEKMTLLHQRKKIKIKGYESRSMVYAITPIHCEKAQKLLDQFPTLEMDKETGC